MPYAIYPPIGIGRVGNDLSQFYIGPEIPGLPGSEPNGLGGENAVVHYKVDEDQIKRQAARFRIFEIPAGGGSPVPANLPADAIVEWTVHLVNKKGAVIRQAGPPVQPVRPQLAPNPSSRIIDPGSRTISGADASGVKFDTGEFQGRRVPLGELRTDANQNLLVLGGAGFSSSPTNSPLSNFYTNPGWHDDVSDGSVNARIRFANNTTIDAVPAWVVISTPDFAPEILGVVTLYDILLQMGIDHFSVSPPSPVSFTRHMFPLLQRTRRLRWVNTDPNWPAVSDNFAALADPSSSAAQLRSENADRVREIESILSRYHLTDLQGTILDAWVSGNFQSDWNGLPQPGNTLTSDGMTRAALDSTVGQGFFPGIEAGIIVLDHTLYAVPFDFRLNPDQATPGDLTALMAVPWQADFWDCSRSWWPTQRPDNVRELATTSTIVRWDRGVGGHLDMVHHFSKLGFITAQKDDQGNLVFAEDQRAPGEHFD